MPFVLLRKSWGVSSLLKSYPRHLSEHASYHEESFEVTGESAIREFRGEIEMLALTLTVICVVVLCVMIVIWIKRTGDRREMELHSIAPEALHALLASNQEVLLYDVRLPLDLLADSEIIPGAARIAPQELLENPLLIPREKDSIVYCTCPSDKTSRVILRRAQAMHFLRIKFLRGGLAGWKGKGYPVERYEKPFHLDTRTGSTS